MMNEKTSAYFSIGASVEEMENMATIAVVDAQEKQKRLKNF
jgi:malate dehydrogenase (oxaloacetate-decarboxylating)(NADP+)